MDFFFLKLNLSKLVWYPLHRFFKTAFLFQKKQCLLIVSSPQESQKKQHFLTSQFRQRGPSTGKTKLHLNASVGGNLSHESTRWSSITSSCPQNYLQSAPLQDSPVGEGLKTRGKKKEKKHPTKKKRITARFGESRASQRWLKGELQSSSIGSD